MNVTTTIRPGGPALSRSPVDRWDAQAWGEAACARAPRQHGSGLLSAAELRRVVAEMID